MRWWLLGLVSAALAADLLPSCPVGFTGDSCQNPICSSASLLTPHDGRANFGDTLALFHSLTCSEQFTFPVDNFAQDIYISVSTSSDDALTFSYLYDQQGNGIEVCNVQFVSDNEMMTKFCMEGHPKGLYLLKLSSQKDGECIVRVSSPTSLSVDGGFVENPRDDDLQQFSNSENQGIGRFPTLGIPAFLAFRVQNENFPTQPQKVDIYRDGVADEQFDLVARFNCFSPHITKLAYNCPSISKYHAVFTGIDNSGNEWQRVYDFICNAGNSTQPTGTPAPQPPIDECYNGGILTPARTCFCGEFFDGEQCEWKLCMNGGTLNQRTETCLCATGWSGDHCEHVRCKTREDDFYNQNQRALGFVIRAAASMEAQMDQIVRAAQNITQDADEAGYYQKFVLSVVKNNGIQFTKQFDNAQSFIQSIQSLPSPPVDTVCSDALLLGVTEVLKTSAFQEYPNSPIFVFSDGVMNDGYATEGYALQQLSKTRAQVFFILSDSASGKCNVDISSEGYQNLIGFAAFSQGLAIKADLLHLSDTAQMLSESLFGATNLAMNDLLDCRRAPQFQPFFIDETISRVFIAATGTDLSLTLTLPDLTTMKPVIFFFSGNLHIWMLDKPKTGSYMLNLNNSVNAANECSWRVYAPSTYAVTFGASTDMLTDMVNSQPVMGKESHIVARISNVYVPDPIDISAEITLWLNDLSSGRVVLYSSSGIWRDGCLYDLYFGSFECTAPGMGFYASVYLTDSRGLTILRTTTGYCQATLPPMPGEQCQNGGATFNNTCICPSHFAGDKCQITLCENQGTPLFGLCQCPPGFSGQFCETIACTQYNQYTGVTPDYRSLTFLMHDTITTRSVLRSINDVTSRVVHDIVHQHPLWFMNYQLIRFNDTDFSSVSDSSDPEQFIQGITTLFNSNQQHSDYSCANLDLYATLLKALLDDNVAAGGVFYVFLYGVARPDSDSYDKIITHLEDTRIQINVVQFSMNPCGQDYTKDGLMALTQYSGGTYFLSSGPNAGNVVKSLPTLHGSGLIYERFVNNCNDTTFYVPVDANTQSFTSYIQGELVEDPVYTQPDGNVASSFSLNNVWNDIGSDSRMDQIVQACDNGWYLNDGHCWIFYGQMATWQDAKGKCAAAGASLATIYNKQDQQYLDKKSTGSMFWIGLNDIVDYNKWMWDTTNGNTLSLNSTRYLNWAPNEPAQDTSKRCVVDDNHQNTYGWVAADCQEKHYFACVKTMYNTEFEPSATNENLVQRGIWSVRVKADGACSILLRAQSTLQILPVYTTNIHSDFGVIEPIQGTSNNRLIARVTGLIPGTTHSLEYAHIYGNDGSLKQIETISHRESCAFDYISTPFQCIGSSFQMMLTGVDSFGFSYQRVVPVLCLSGPTVDSCENGGTYYEGICVCPPNFYGEHCEVIACYNGGYPHGSLAKCQCPGNFQGRFCELPRCTRGGDILPDVGVNGKTFVLAIDGSSTGSMEAVLNNLPSTLNSLLTKVDNSNPTWFTSYVAVVFRDSLATSVPIFSNTLASNNKDDWITMIGNELKNNPYKSTITSRAIFAALAQALSHPLVKPGSFAFVLTNSKAEDIRNEDVVLTATAYTHSSINIMFIGDTAAPGGGSYNDPAVSDLFEAAHNSGGNAYQVATTANLASAWGLIMGTMYNSYTLIAHHVNNCSSYTDYLQLGSNGTEVIVDVFQLGSPSVQVTNADGQKEQALTLFASKTNTLTEFVQMGENPGVWGITFKGSSDSCMFNVRGLSNLQIYVAFTQDVAQDGGYHDGNAVAYPRADGQSNAVVATMTDGGSLTHAQIFDIEEHNLIWASPLIPRALCAYSFISSQTFVCDRASFLLAIDGLDVVGHPYRRLFTFHCQGYIPPPTPSVPTPVPTTTSAGPTTTGLPQCDRSVPKVDLVIAFDSSSTISNGDYVDIVGAFHDFYEVITFGTTRIMMGDYDQKANFGNGTLDTVNSFQTYVEEWINLSLMGYTGSDGNNMDDVFQYLLTDTNVRSPFRADARKIVVIISSIGWDKGNFYDNVEHGYADPSADVAALKALGVEFIPIAYGAQANLQQLSALSSKCLKTAHNPDDMVNIVAFISSNICQTTPQC